MTTHLTDTQKQTIRIALARWSGWTEVNNQHGGYHYGYSPKGIWGKVSDCCASLDACHEIEVKLNFSQRLKFHKELQKIESGEFNGALLVEYRECISASAEQRSLALFLALNLGELGD